MIYRALHMCKVKDAPIGLFVLEDSGELICISEYNLPGGSRQAIIVSSGEYYHGRGDEGEGYPIIIDNIPLD